MLSAAFIFQSPALVNWDSDALSPMRWVPGSHGYRLQYKEEDGDGNEEKWVISIILEAKGILWRMFVSTCGQWRKPSVNIGEREYRITF